jgi:hypothetical protein
MEFSGSQWLTSGVTNDWAFLNQATGGTVIAVWKPGNTSDPNTLYGLFGTNRGTVTVEGTYTIFDDRASVPRNNQIIIASRSAVGVGNQTFLSESGDNFLTANQPGLVSIICDPANATAANKFLMGANGGNLTGNNTNTNGASTLNPEFPLQIGAVGNNTWPLTGYIAEVCFFRTPLNNLNRQLIEGYLAWKWGLEANLPVSHPYKNAAPQAPTGIGGEVGWWCPSLDDAGNGTGVLNDLTGNSNEGTLTNMDPATDWVADTSSGGVRALDFDGVNDQLFITHSSVLMPVTAISISVWVKFNISLASQIDFITLAAKENYGANTGYFLAFRTDQPDNFLSFRINGSLTVNSINWAPTTFFDDLAWHHICATYDKTTMRLFVDGVQRASAAYTADIGSNTNNLGPFSRGAWRGDDLRIFNRAISSTEIALLYSKRGYQPVSNTRRRRYAGSYGL